jgi:hypothetical protein
VRLSGTVTGNVVIRRPVHVVYSFYRDFTNLPRLLGDVAAVEQVADTTYRWIVAGPLGIRVPVTVTITEHRVNQLIHYQTSGPAAARSVGADLRRRYRRRRHARAGAARGAARCHRTRHAGRDREIPGREVAANLTRLNAGSTAPIP